MYNRILLLSFILCGSLSAQKLSTQQYIEEFKYAAMQEMKVYGIPASVTLAQGILESASGNSKLAKDCNNHFGIKCHKNWSGSFCLADDDAQDECFRGYVNAMESYRDHSLFLKGSSRYNFLFTLPATDYRAWAHGLRQAGYATNPSYGNIIIGVVERFRLSMYDSMTVLGDDYETPDTAAGRLIKLHGLPAVIVSKSQNPEEIAKLYDMGVWQIYKYNDLKRGEELKPGEIIYLKPKKRKADEDFHLVKEGETLRDISQQHAVKLKHLEKFNDIMSSQPLKSGEVIYLREKRKKDSAASSEAAKKTQALTGKDSGIQMSNVAESRQVLAGSNVKSSEFNDEASAGRDTFLSGQSIQRTARASETTDLMRAEGDFKGELSYHTVLSGETVYSISRLYKISVDSVLKWNRLLDARIRVGQELRISALKERTQQKEIHTHTVSAGETLYQISRRYSVSVSELQDKNQLRSAEIKVGQVLLIP
ncbi:MAG: LysM peptidoglycan-binding domain-containing protein [Bacteroidetes bacterium]|nr:LysM peptidoglycan-binding domain-containing protein [Bacteroidota bacterium]